MQAAVNEFLRVLELENQIDPLAVAPAHPVGDARRPEQFLRVADHTVRQLTQARRKRVVEFRTVVRRILEIQSAKRPWLAGRDRVALQTRCKNSTMSVFSKFNTILF